MTAVELKHQAKLQEWQERILECRSSGQTVRAWCRERGVSSTTYYQWEREIFGKAAGAQKEQAMEHVPGGAVFAEVAVPKEGQQGIPTMTIRIDGMAVDIYPGADSDIVKAICEALKGC